MRPGTISGPYIHTAGSCAAWTKMRCGETYTATSIDAGQNQHRRTKRNLAVTFFFIKHTGELLRGKSRCRL
jgi:hypothetical protein